eukprot:SAG31_NODE_148_length_22511_cov_20.369266_4_plen_79_part_00
MRWGRGVRCDGRRGGVVSERGVLARQTCALWCLGGSPPAAVLMRRAAQLGPQLDTAPGTGVVPVHRTAARECGTNLPE